MTAIFGWIIFVAGLVVASAAIVVPGLLASRFIFPTWKPSARAIAALTAAGAVALWFIIPATIHAAFGSG